MTITIQRIPPQEAPVSFTVTMSKHQFNMFCEMFAYDQSIPGAIHKEGLITSEEKPAYSQLFYEMHQALCNR